MKFSFATAFLTLSAAVVFAAPAQDDSTIATGQTFPGVVVLNGFNINGRVDGEPVAGHLSRHIPLVVVDHAKYNFNKLSDLDGPFKGHVEHDEVSIKYIKSGATITGKTNAGHLSIDFTGVTNVA